jgi:hypothetical protein
MRTVCLNIVKVAAVVVCLGIGTSACFWGERGRDVHHEDRHEDRHEEHR